MSVTTAEQLQRNVIETNPILGEVIRVTGKFAEDKTYSVLKAVNVGVKSINALGYLPVAHADYLKELASWCKRGKLVRCLWHIPRDVHTLKRAITGESDAAPLKADKPHFIQKLNACVNPVRELLEFTHLTFHEVPGWEAIKGYCGGSLAFGMGWNLVDEKSWIKGALHASYLALGVLSVLSYFFACSVSPHAFTLLSALTVVLTAVDFGLKNWRKCEGSAAEDSPIEGKTPGSHAADNKWNLATECLHHEMSDCVEVVENAAGWGERFGYPTGWVGEVAESVCEALAVPAFFAALGQCYNNYRLFNHKNKDADLKNFFGGVRKVQIAEKSLDDARQNAAHQLFCHAMLLLHKGAKVFGFFGRVGLKIAQQDSLKLLAKRVFWTPLLLLDAVEVDRQLSEYRKYNVLIQEASGPSKTHFECRRDLAWWNVAKSATTVAMAVLVLFPPVSTLFFAAETLPLVLSGLHAVWLSLHFGTHFYGAAVDGAYGTAEQINDVWKDRWNKV